MKNIINYFLITLISLVILSGCFGSTVPDIEDRFSDEITIGMEYDYSGTIKTIPIDVYKLGTHEFITNDGKSIIIQSQNVDLNKFLDKKVNLIGIYQKAKGKQDPVLNVSNVTLQEDEKSENVLSYENRLFGFKLDYPENWILNDEKWGITVLKEENEMLSVGVYSDKTDLDVFVKTKETKTGDEITVAKQRSLRFTDGETIKVYIPNPPKKKVYQIIFNEAKNEVSDVDKDNFNDILKSFDLFYIEAKTGEKCGGVDKVKCPEEFRCEYSSAEEDASGICVQISGEGVTLDCPFISIPSCENYRVSEYNPKTNCPSRYTCAGEETEKVTEIPPTAEQEIDEEEELAEETDLDSETEADKETETVSKPISSDMSLYENSYKEFAIQYPKNWYFESYGAINNTLWTVGFAENALESFDDSVITFSIIKEKKSSSNNLYTVYKNREDGNFYALEGPMTLKSTIDKMADSLD